MSLIQSRRLVPRTQWLTGNKGYLFGLTLSNNAGDATNDIDFAAGTTADANGGLMTLAAMTKRLDAAWAVGTAAGGRMSAAAIADTTYHCFVIRKDNDGTVDCGFDVSATAPTMPSGYTYFRRIGSIIRSGATILAFKQDGDRFRLATAIADIADTNPGTSAVTRTLSVPIGIVVQADFAFMVVNGTTSIILQLITALDETDRAPSATDFNGQAGNGASIRNAAPMYIKTNTSAQIRSRWNASGAADVLRINTFGWIDRRGQDS